MKLHIHAISVHLPAALFPTAALFLILYLITDNPSFEITSYFFLIIALLGTLIGFISGLYDRWKHFVHWAPIFVKKTVLSILLLIFGGICVIWRGLVWTAVIGAYAAIVPVGFSSGEFAWYSVGYLIYAVITIIILPVLTGLLVYYGLILSYGRYGGRASYGKPILYQPKEEEIEEKTLDTD